MSDRGHQDNTPPQRGVGGQAAEVKRPAGSRRAPVHVLPIIKGAEQGTQPEPRTGEDARRRGWFWHWNSVVTQYAPLIGLKGVGLLNSYTVWTDRRDESPHRGYAFPSQQAESAFYGEERAELITINKILVALDLIEIRKEMIQRTDDRGRRWRVPHNLYRVKDRQDGVDLRADDVLCVLELAESDDAVFRYIRRIFSERFSPIDRDNVWHGILTELRQHPTWQRLRQRAALIEARASARTRAGHQTRAGRNGAVLTDGHSGDGSLFNDERDSGASQGAWTSVGASNTAEDEGDTGGVAGSNTGLSLVVDGSSTGCGVLDAGIDAPSNSGSSRSVGPSNTTYHQPLSTTTTTTTTPDADDVDAGGSQSAAYVSSARRDAVNDGGSLGNALDSTLSPLAAADRGASITNLTPPIRPATGRTVAKPPTPLATRADRTVAGDPSGQPPPAELEAMGGLAANGMETTADQPGAGASAGGDEPERVLSGIPAAGGPVGDPSPLVVSLFEAANDRRATPLEHILLAELERDADPAARRCGAGGADWVAAALREAVASGSRFVAPKRVREIITRWAAEADGLDPTRGAAAERTNLTAAGAARSTRPRALSGTADAAEPVAQLPATDADGSLAVTHAPPADVRLPGGASGSTVWRAVLSDLARALDPATFERLFAGSMLLRYRQGTVDVQVPSAAAADKLAGEYRPLVERHLNARLRRPVALRFVPVDDAPAQPPRPQPPVAPVDDSTIRVSPADAELGRQLWRSLLDSIATVVSPADLQRLAGVVLLGQDAHGVLLLGVPTRHIQRLLDTRYHVPIEQALAQLFGQGVPFRTVDAREWTITDD